LCKGEGGGILERGFLFRGKKTTKIYLMTKPPLSNFLSTAIRLLRKMGRGREGSEKSTVF